MPRLINKQSGGSVYCEKNQVEAMLASGNYALEGSPSNSAPEPAPEEDLEEAQAELLEEDADDG